MIYDRGVKGNNQSQRSGRVLLMYKVGSSHVLRPGAYTPNPTQRVKRANSRSQFLKPRNSRKSRSARNKVSLRRSEIFRVGG
jgi:hypothetical protein